MRVQVLLLLLLITGCAAATAWGAVRAGAKASGKKRAAAASAASRGPQAPAQKRAKPAAKAARAEQAKRASAKAQPVKTRKRAARRKGRKAEAPQFEPYVVQNWPAEAVARIPTAWIETPPAPPVGGNCRVCETMLLASAYEQIGIRYRRGGASPETGFDCSGLMRYLFERNFQISLPPTAPQQYQTGLRVEKWELEPGDLVFFRTRRGWHVGLYVGNDAFLHAPNRRKTVRVSPLFGDNYWRRAFVGARRVPLPELDGAVVSENLSANNN